MSINPAVPCVQLSDEDLSDLQRALDLVRGCVAVLLGEDFGGDDDALTARKLADEAGGALRTLLDRLEGERARAHEQARNSAQAAVHVGAEGGVR